MKMQKVVTNRLTGVGEGYRGPLTAADGAFNGRFGRGISSHFSGLTEGLERWIGWVSAYSGAPFLVGDTITPRLKSGVGRVS